MGNDSYACNCDNPSKFCNEKAFIDEEITAFKKQKSYHKKKQILKSKITKIYGINL